MNFETRILWRGSFLRGRITMDGNTTSFLDETIWSGKIFSGAWLDSAGGKHNVNAPADGSPVGTVGK
jgi:hypothetical protein